VVSAIRNGRYQWKERSLPRGESLENLITEHVWDYDSHATSNLVEIYIHDVRDKVDRGYSRQLIRTVRGLGYTIKAWPRTTNEQLCWLPGVCLFRVWWRLAHRRADVVELDGIRLIALSSVAVTTCPAPFVVAAAPRSMSKWTSRYGERPSAIKDWL
jgi:Transcriptional regulatory protein, C terminal